MKWSGQFAPLSWANARHPRLTAMMVPFRSSRATAMVRASRMPWAERLSGLSSGLGEFLAGVAGFGVEPDQQLVGERDADDLFGLAGLAQAGVEGGEVGLEAADHFGDHEQDAPHTGAPAAHG